MTSKQKLLQLAVEGVRGRRWYQEGASAIDTFLAPSPGKPRTLPETTTFIRTLAVLSPQVSVTQNMRLAVGWCVFDIDPNVVTSVYSGFQRLVESDYTRSAIKGPKTGRFADALEGDPSAVVLDTHMGYALNVPSAKLRNKSVQTEAEKRIRWVANTLGWEPREVQAAIWTARRASSGYVDTGITYDLLVDAYNHQNPDPF